MKEKQGEDGPLLRAAERQVRPVRGDLKRAEDAKIEFVRLSTVAPRSTRIKAPGREVRGRSRPSPHLTS
jgi:hypothetical protein